VTRMLPGGQGYVVSWASRGPTSRAAASRPTPAG
jgi:hypothetical protein